MPEYESPVIMERVLKKIAGGSYPVGRDDMMHIAPGEYDMIEITHAKTGELLATCMMSDDASIEAIADALSSKRLWREANRLRQMWSESKRRTRNCEATHHASR